MKKQKVYLCLENGQTFEGYRFGAGGESDSWHARFNINIGYYF